MKITYSLTISKQIFSIICLGTLTGFRFYIQIIRPVVIGLYRPLGGCSYKTIALWTPSIRDVGLNNVTSFLKYSVLKIGDVNGALSCYSYFRILILYKY